MKVNNIGLYLKHNFSNKVNKITNQHVSMGYDHVGSMDSSIHDSQIKFERPGIFLVFI